MKLTEKQKQEFIELAKPLMEFIAKTCHPHVMATVDGSKCELLEGVVAYNSDEYIRD